MLQYTTPDQTAKLIELGFEKPKFEIETQLCNINGQPMRVATIVGNYSIGELIEMLPPKLGGHHLLIERYIEYGQWLVYYEISMSGSIAPELIDALYNMIVKLKEVKIL